MRADGRPNILLIMVDQLAARWLPIYGHRVVHAPHLSALAELSTVFDSAFGHGDALVPGGRIALVSEEKEEA